MPSFPQRTHAELASSAGMQRVALSPVGNDLAGENTFLLSKQGKVADEVWTQPEGENLWTYLHNANGDYQFAMAWRKNSQKHYAKSKKVIASRAISWGWRSIAGELGSTKRTAFVPYCQNAQGMSRWGCLDFDAHDGNHERATALSFAAFRHLLNTGHTIIWEHTGGGWHVWIIAKEFRHVRDWTLFLRGVAKAIDAPIKSGICEVFPDAGKSKGVRAPGSWNPATDAPNAIFWENTADLLKGLRCPIGEVRKRSEENFPDTESNIYGEVDRLYPSWHTHWQGEFAIVQESTRHSRLLALVGEVFRQVGFRVAEKLAETQYRESIVTMRASLKVHLEEFRAMWTALLEKWRLELTEAERRGLAALRSDNERDGFRIARSFDAKAKTDGKSDFPIARNNFGDRLGITHKGGGHVRDRLMAAGVIQRTAHYRQYVAAARYSWLLHEGGFPAQGLMEQKK
jgi:hypothetical protein